MTAKDIASTVLRDPTLSKTAKVGQGLSLDQSTHRRHGRRRPYTWRGIRRLPCFRCGKKAHATWQICADGNLFHPLCANCDLELNRLVLEFFRFPNAVEISENYERTNGAAEALAEPRA